MSEMTLKDAYISIINAIIDDCRAKIASSEAKKREIRSKMTDICRDFDGFRAKKEENHA
jgi:hypothetical protein